MSGNITQQKQIRAFLTFELEQKKGEALFQKQAATLDAIIGKTTGKTKNQLAMLRQTILPRIALYQAFLNSGFSGEEATRHLKQYMLGVVAAKKHASMKRLEKLPGFYALYSHIFLHIMRTTDLQASIQQQGKGFYDVTITTCLWHTACTENGCAELCRLFCDVDDITYGNLQKIGFSRTQTLGYGQSCCDFHFFKKSTAESPLAPEMQRKQK